MPVVNFTLRGDKPSHEIELVEGESILNALLRKGVDVPFGCKSGVCQSCLMVGDVEHIPPDAQQGLNAAQKQQGYFLSCCFKPKQDVQVKMGLTTQKSLATVLDKTLLNSDIVRLRLSKVFDYKPGQFCTLWKDAQTARSYSLASCYETDEFLEFHIKVIEDGVFSGWVQTQLRIGDKIAVQGPLGQCFYTQNDSDKSLFLAGIGTGMAPLYGIIRDALQFGHTPNIHLLIGAKKIDNLYLQHELAVLANRHSNFSYHVVVLEKLTPRKMQTLPEDTAIHCGDIYEFAKQKFSDFSKTKVFLCGADSFVKKMKRQCFMAGASMRDICSDPFIPFAKK